MDLFLQQTFSGLAFGGIYALVALAVVMIYQATDHLNFAQGEMAMFSTYIAYTLLHHGVPYWWAFLLAMAISFVGGVLVERIIVRPVEGTGVLNEVIVFIGLLAIFNSMAGWIWEYTIKPFPSPFPKHVPFGITFIGPHEFGVIGVTLVVLAAVFLFFRFTPVGLAMRAAAQNPASARLVGIRVGWMLALGWGLAAAIGAVGRHDGRADRVPRAEHDAGHPALRFCRRAAGRHHQPGGRGGRRLHGRGAGEPGSAPTCRSSAASSSSRSRWC